MGVLNKSRKGLFYFFTCQEWHCLLCVLTLKDIVVLQFSDDSGLPRTLSQDSDSDEDVPDELKADYIDENTGDLPPPVRK